MNLLVEGKFMNWRTDSILASDKDTIDKPIGGGHSEATLKTAVTSAVNEMRAGLVVDAVAAIKDQSSPQLAWIDRTLSDWSALSLAVLLPC
jgi:hypothetical protein